MEGRDAIIIDDMISTGGSVVKAAEFLKKQGCGRIFAACTHALLTDGAKSKIRRAGVSKIVCANTMPAGRESRVSRRIRRDCRGPEEKAGAAAVNGYA